MELNSVIRTVVEPAWRSSGAIWRRITVLRSRKETGPEVFCCSLRPPIKRRGQVENSHSSSL